VPPTTDKPKQFAFILAEDEHRMLHDLAEADGRSSANWLRMIIRREFQARTAGERRKKGSR
jgi:hypothetical protein